MFRIIKPNVPMRRFSLKVRINNIHPDHWKNFNKTFLHDDKLTQNMIDYQVSIKGLDRMELTKKLWNGSKPAAFFENAGVKPPEFIRDEAKQVYHMLNGRLDYICGRAIKTDLEPDWVNPNNYNDYNGAGKFERIVYEMNK